MPAPGSPVDGDIAVLVRALGGAAIADLKDKTLKDLRNIYRLCFSGGKGITR